MGTEEEHNSAKCPWCGAAGATAPPAKTRVTPEFHLLTVGGLLMAILGAYVGNSTLPRFVTIAEVYRIDLGTGTSWVLANGGLQPLPGCLLMVVSLIGLLSPRSASIMRVLAWCLLFAGVFLFGATWAALMRPEFVLV